MIGQLWVAGFPSTYGGADTELDHLIDLLRRFDVDVTLVPMFGTDEKMRQDVMRRGCRVQPFTPGVFRDRVVVSLCNDNFLTRLPEIMSVGRPRRVIWLNCMTWPFDRELIAHRNGWIDYFGFASEYQQNSLLPVLQRIRPVVSFRYAPYFNWRRVEWKYRPWDGCYKLGRISRDDGAKFAADTWRIFDRVLTPAGLQKKVYVLGYGPNAAAKIGSAPPGLDWRTWSANEIPATDFYRTIDTMIHKTGGSRESYCRVLVEAYAHGVVPIVERDFAFPELVVDGETGFMSSDSDTMSYLASTLAHDPARHRRLAEAGRRHLETKLSAEQHCWSTWQTVLAD